MANKRANKTGKNNPKTTHNTLIFNNQERANKRANKIGKTTQKQLMTH